METEGRKEVEVIIATLLCYIKLAQKEEFNGPLAIHDLIKTIKKLKKERKKNINDFFEQYLIIIENIINQLEDNAQELDNFALFQLKLVSFLNKYLEKQEILEQEASIILNLLKKVVEDIFGVNYLAILDKIGLLNCIKTNVNSPLLILKDIANIILNIHPNIFNENLNEFIILTNDNFLKYFDFSYPETSNFKDFGNIFTQINNNLTIFEKMKIYKEKTRYVFFIEFKNQQQFLNIINKVLSNMNEKVLLNLEKEPDDNDFLKQKIKYLLTKNKTNKKNMETVEKELINKKQELNEVKKELDFTKNKLKDLEKEFSEKEEKILSLKQINDTLTEEFEDIYKKLEISDKKHCNHLHRKSCGRIEEYFFNAIETSAKNEIINQLNNKTNQKLKIDLIIDEIKRQFPYLLSNLEKNGINIPLLLKYVNKFRKENNAEVHDFSKINQETLIKTLQNYFKNDNFDFSKILKYMFINFKYLLDYSFDPKFETDENLYDYFNKKEMELNAQHDE